MSFALPRSPLLASPLDLFHAISARDEISQTLTTWKHHRMTTEDNRKKEQKAFDVNSKPVLIGKQRPLRFIE
jgi:hypothetical protein